MYKIGCCIPGASFMPQTGGEKAYIYDAFIKGYNFIINTGFDFAEATVGTLTELTEKQIAAAADSGMVIEACNSFVPPSLALFSTKDSILREYVSDVMRKAALLKTEYIILGSGKAREIPEGTKESERLSPLTSFLKICSDCYLEYGIKIALEPLRSEETNCINKVSEGFDFLKELNLPGVFLLADSYHMYVENEPLSVLSDTASLLRHIHISESDRKPPGKGENDYLENFAKELKATPYSGRVSVECVFSPGEFETECATSYKTAKHLFKR